MTTDGQRSTQPSPSPSTAVGVGVGVVASLDLCSKVLASHLLPKRDLRLGPIALELSHNTGIAFGVGADAPRWVVALGTGAVLAGLVVMLLRSGVAALPASLLLGGAVANLVDRGVDGMVTDFIAIGWWPNFNLADSAIVLGALALVMAERSRPATRSQ